MLYTLIAIWLANFCFTCFAGALADIIVLTTDFFDLGDRLGIIYEEAMTRAEATEKCKSVSLSAPLIIDTKYKQFTISRNRQSIIALIAVLLYLFTGL